MIVIIHSTATIKVLVNRFWVLKCLGCVSPKSNCHFSLRANHPPLEGNTNIMQLKNGYENSDLIF